VSAAGERFDMTPVKTIRWATVIFLVPFLELLGRNILINLNNYSSLIFDWALVGIFLLVSLWLLAFASRTAAVVLLAYCVFSILALAYFIFLLDPHGPSVASKIYNFGLLFLWISASVLMFNAFLAARDIQRGRRLGPDLVAVFD
jgi:hypothetical protein